MTIPKHPLHAQFDEVLVEIFEVKDNWYFSKNNFVSSKHVIIEIDKEMTELFKVKDKAQSEKTMKTWIKLLVSQSKGAIVYLDWILPCDWFHLKCIKIFIQI